MAEKCISQAVSFVFFILIARDGENKEFLFVFFGNEGQNHSLLRSVIKNMCVAAKCISQAVSLVFFILRARNAKNKKFFCVFI